MRYGCLCLFAGVVNGAQSLALCGNTSSLTYEISSSYDAEQLATDISCSKGTFSVIWYGEVSLNSTLSLEGGTSLNIRGGDALASIDGEANIPLFDVYDGALSIEGLTLRNGNASDTEGGYVQGGAIRVNRGRLSVAGCTFDSNQAAESGGAIYASSSEVFVENSAFVNSKAGEPGVGTGGGIHVYLGKALIRNSAIYRCFAGEIGGGAWLKSGDFTVFNTTFVENMAGDKSGTNFVENVETPGRGGGLSVDRCEGGFYGGPCQIDLNLFQDNFAGEKGGGVVVGGGGVYNNIKIERCTFRYNSAGKTDPAFDDFPAGDGGAVSVGGGFFVLAINSTFERNLAGGKGGAIVTSTNSELEVCDSVFSANEARGEGGGAITVGSRSKLEINSSYFVSNYAEDSGGAIAALSYSTVLLKNGTFHDNYANQDGGVMTAQGLVLVSSGTFGGNVARLNGGVFYASENSNFTISGGSFSFNSAKSNGGSLYLGIGSEMLVSNGTFFGNKALNSGGFVFVNGHFRVTGGTFHNNSAEEGGFICVHSSYASCSGITVENHEAVNGGVIYAASGARLDWNCNSTNSYGILGGIMYLRLSSSVNITRSSFTGITMPRGSAIFLLDSSLTMEKAVVEDTHRTSLLVAIQANHNSVVHAYDSSFRGFTGEVVVFSEGELVLDGCDFSVSYAQRLVHSSYSVPPVIRNTLLGNLNYAIPISDGVTSESAGFVNQAYTCADQLDGGGSLCSSEKECLDGDMGVYCNCYMPKFSMDREEVCLDRSNVIHFSEDSSEHDLLSNTFFSPDNLMADLTLEADSSVETATLWSVRVIEIEDMEGAKLDVIWDIFPSKGILMPGTSITVRVTGRAPLDLNGPVKSKFVVSTGAQVEYSSYVMVTLFFFHCNIGLFWADQGECRYCSTLGGASEGVDCSMPGSTQKTLHLTEGFWRASDTSLHIEECRNKVACAGASHVTSVDDYCLEGYRGPYCALCSDNYGQGSSFTCNRCTVGFRAFMYLLVTVLLLLFLASFILLGVYLVGGAAAVQSLERSASIFKIRNPTPFSTSSPLPNARVNSVANKILANEAAVDASDRHDTEGWSAKQFASKVLSHIPFQKMKIVMVVWQIVSQFATITQIAYPPMFEKFLSVISALNFDLGWILSASCVMSGIKFYNKLLIITIAPMVVVLFLVCTFWLGTKRAASISASLRGNRCPPNLSMSISEDGIGSSSTSHTVSDEENDKNEEDLPPSRETLRQKNLLGERFPSRSLKVSAKWESNMWQLYSRHINVLLITCYLLYTQLCTVVFQTFECEELDGGASGESYLSADLRISCQSPGRTGFVVYAAVMVFVYPVGVPIGFACLLWHQKERINPPIEDEDEQHKGKYYIQMKQLEQRDKDIRLIPTAFLWKSYRPGGYNYEVIECFRRLFLTGLLVVIIPHSSGQVAVGCMFAFLSLVLFELLRPHLEPTDRMLYRMGCLVIFFTNFLGLMIKAEVTVTDSCESAAYAVLLIIANVFLLLSAWISTWISLSAALKEKSLQIEIFDVNLSRDD